MGAKLDKFGVPTDVITDNKDYVTHRPDEQEALDAALASLGWDDCSYHTAELIVGDTAAPYYSVYIEGADGASYTVNISTVDGGALSVF